MPAEGGEPRLVWEERHADDIILLETGAGRAVLLAETGGGAHRLVLRTPEGDRRVLALLDSSWPELAYSATGHVLYRGRPNENPTLWALPFSPQALDIVGEPFLVERSGMGPSVADDGTLVYLNAGAQPIGRQRLASRDREGTLLREAADSHRTIVTLDLSPNGTEALVVVTEQGPGEAEFWLYDLERMTGEPLAHDGGGAAVTGVWTEQGDAIHYTIMADALTLQTRCSSRPCVQSRRRASSRPSTASRRRSTRRRTAVTSFPCTARARRISASGSSPSSRAPS